MTSTESSFIGEMARVAFEESPDAIVLSRLEDGVVVAVNQVFLSGTGLLREDVLGRSTVALGLWETEAQRRQVVGRLQAQGILRDVPVEPARKAPDGTRVSLLQSMRWVEIGGVAHVLSISRNITSQKLLEQRLQAERDRLAQSEARFRALIEKSTDMVFLLDAQWRIQFWSPSATECLGWTAEEVVGRDPHELGLVHAEDLPAAERARAVAAAQPRAPVPALLRLRRKDGAWRLVESLGRNLLDDPAVRGVVMNARDVTEQRALEEQVHQAQRLESIGRLAGGVAHDFNNLLTAILSCAEVLREEGGAAPSAEVEQILAAGWRARDLTRQLLAFARKQVITPVRLDLNEVVRGSEGLYRRVLGEDVRIETQLAAELWPVLCDRGQLEQVLMNLVVNARDAMPAGGRLVLRTENVAAAGGPAAGEEVVRLVVEDSGTGMSAEVRAHLFEPFFTTKPPGKGTGLGLATVYGIVTQNGGAVAVESEPGRGTAVSISFPRTAVAPDAPPPQPAAGTARSARPPPRGALLVVEDDALVRAVTVRALTGAGYQVLVAAEAGEALELVAREPAPLDLVVTDVVMPGMSGAAMVDALRIGQPGLRALFLSGYSGDAIAERGVLGPGVEFLPKPFTPSTLIERVRAILDRQ